MNMRHKKKEVQLYLAKSGMTSPGSASLNAEAMGSSSRPRADPPNVLWDDTAGCAGWGEGCGVCGVG